MKTLYLVFFLIGLSQSESGRPNEKCWRECDPANYVALVKCKTGEENVDEPCTCEHKGEVDPDCAGDIKDRTGPLNWTQCHDLANTYGAKDLPLEAFFFRWEDGTETSCYFLPDCDQPTAGNCAPFDDAPCVAGPSTVKCEEDPDESEDLFCPRATWNENGLHWSCVFNSKVINPYPVNAQDDSLLPKGTTCVAGTNGLEENDCLTWSWSDDDTDRKKDLIVTCGDDEWAQVQVSDQPEVFLNSGDPAVPILPDGSDGPNDAVCNCGGLSVTEALATPGLTFICDTAITNDEIVNGNACAVLCDFHMVMYIECYKGIWMRTDTYPFNEVTPDQIKC